MIDHSESDPVKFKKINEEKNVVNISDLIGSWGPFQKRIFLIVGLLHCIDPFSHSSLFYYSIKDDIICEKSNGTQVIIQPDKCSFEDLDGCIQWDFSSTRITISKEWTFICERYWLRSITLSAYLIGQAIAGIIFGWVSDQFGRKFAIKYSVFFEIICEFSLIVASDETSFFIMRVFHGIAGFGRSLCAIILLMESVDPKYRGKIMFWYDSCYHGCSFLMIGIAYLVPSFRYIYFGSAIFQLIGLMFIKFLPESPRWQLISGKTVEAEITLRRFSAELNDNSRFNEKFDKLKIYLRKFNAVKQSGMLSLFRRCKTAQLVLILCTIWFLRTIDGSGLHYCTLDLPGNIFVNNAIFSLFATLAVLSMTLQADNHQRKVLLITFFTINSVVFYSFALFLANSTSDRYLVIKIIFIAIATFCNGALHNLLYVYTPEVYPTSIRNLGTGVCTVASEIAAIFGPFINQLTAITSLKVTFIGLALPSSIAALLVTTLPETKGVEMPDTVDQMLLLSADSDNEDSL